MKERCAVPCSGSVVRIGGAFRASSNGYRNNWEVVAPTFDEVNTPVPEAPRSDMKNPQSCCGLVV